MYGDYLLEMTTDGRHVWEYRLWEHLDPEIDRIRLSKSRATSGQTATDWPNCRMATSS